MEAFQAALDALVKESKEQITNVQEAAAAAVISSHITPHRLAVAIGQRFTKERVETAFPVLCLLDATLVRTAAKAQAPPPASSSSSSSSLTAAAASTLAVSDQALAAVLKEFWHIAPSVFVALNEYGAAQPAWRDKCLRMLRRWKQRRLVTDAVGDAVITALEQGVDVTAEGLPNPTAAAMGVRSSGASDGAAAAAVGSSLPSGHHTSSPHALAQHDTAATTASSLRATSLSAAQAQAFKSTLQACVSALECLPPTRKALFFDLIHAQRFRTPTLVSLHFFEELLGELRREVTAAAGNSTLSSSGATQQGKTAAAASSAATTADAEAKRSSAADAASAGHAREALGKLLSQLHSGSGDDGGGPGSGGGRSGAGGAGAAAMHTAATTVVRYVSPIFSDIYAKQPLGQRGGGGGGSGGGGGFGTLIRKAEHGSTKNTFYTSYYPKAVANAQRPFRIPAAMQVKGGTVRQWFPQPAEWLAAQDMAELPQYASRAAAAERDRKRTRDDA